MKQQSHLHLGPETTSTAFSVHSTSRAKSSKCAVLGKRILMNPGRCLLSLCVLACSRRFTRNHSSAAKTAPLRLKRQLLFLLQSVYNSFRCPGQVRERIRLVSPSFSQISQQFGSCISHNRLGYAAVTKHPSNFIRFRQ